MRHYRTRTLPLHPQARRRRTARSGAVQTFPRVGALLLLLELRQPFGLLFVVGIQPLQGFGLRNLRLLQVHRG